MSEKLTRLTVRATDENGVPQLYVFNVVGTRKDGLEHVQRVANLQGWTNVHIHDYDDVGHMEHHNAVMDERGDERSFTPEDIAEAKAKSPPVEITDHAADVPAKSPAAALNATPISPPSENA